MKQNNDLITRTRTLIDEVERTHRYSMSQIYGLYNEVFSASEVPQSCSSCLIRKVAQLKEWLSVQEIMEDEQPKPTKKKKQKTSK